MQTKAFLHGFVEKLDVAMGRLAQEFVLEPDFKDALCSISLRAYESVESARRMEREGVSGWDPKELPELASDEPANERRLLILFAVIYGVLAVKERNGESYVFQPQPYYADRKVHAVLVQRYLCDGLLCVKQPAIAFFYEMLVEHVRLDQHHLLLNNRCREQNIAFFLRFDRDWKALESGPVAGSLMTTIVHARRMCKSMEDAFETVDEERFLSGAENTLTLKERNSAVLQLLGMLRDEMELWCKENSDITMWRTALGVKRGSRKLALDMAVGRCKYGNLTPSAYDEQLRRSVDEQYDLQDRFLGSFAKKWCDTHNIVQNEEDKSISMVMTLMVKYEDIKPRYGSVFERGKDHFVVLGGDDASMEYIRIRHDSPLATPVPTTTTVAKFVRGKTFVGVKKEVFPAVPFVLSLLARDERYRDGVIRTVVGIVLLSNRAEQLDCWTCTNSVQIRLLELEKNAFRRSVWYSGLVTQLARQLPGNNRLRTALTAIKILQVTVCSTKKEASDILKGEIVGLLDEGLLDETAFYKFSMRYIDNCRLFLKRRSREELKEWGGGIGVLPFVELFLVKYWRRAATSVGRWDLEKVAQTLLGVGEYFFRVSENRFEKGFEEAVRSLLFSLCRLPRELHSLFAGAEFSSFWRLFKPILTEKTTCMMCEGSLYNASFKDYVFLREGHLGPWRVSRGCKEMSMDKPDLKSLLLTTDAGESKRAHVLDTNPTGRKALQRCNHCCIEIHTTCFEKMVDHSPRFSTKCFHCNQDYSQAVEVTWYEKAYKNMLRDALKITFNHRREEIETLLKNYNEYEKAFKDIRETFGDEQTKKRKKRVEPGSLWDLPKNTDDFKGAQVLYKEKFVTIDSSPESPPHFHWIAVHPEKQLVHETELKPIPPRVGDKVAIIRASEDEETGAKFTVQTKEGTDYVLTDQNESVAFVEEHQIVKFA